MKIGMKNNPTITHAFDQAYLILELFNLTTESSINCDDFVQNLHTSQWSLPRILKEEFCGNNTYKITYLVCPDLPCCLFLLTLIWMTVRKEGAVRE